MDQSDYEINKKRQEFSNEKDEIKDTAPIFGLLFFFYGIISLIVTLIRDISVSVYSV